MLIIYLGSRNFGPDPLGGRDVDPLPYTRAEALSVVREWPDITQGETLVAWPSLFRQLVGFIRGSLN